MWQLLVTRTVKLLGHAAFEEPPPLSPPMAEPCKAHCHSASLGTDTGTWLLPQAMGLMGRMSDVSKPSPVVSANGRLEAAGTGTGPLFAPVMDLGKFLKVKKVDGGRPGDSICVRGLVFSNQVAHARSAGCVQVDLAAGSHCRACTDVLMLIPSCSCCVPCWIRSSIGKCHSGCLRGAMTRG